MIGYVIIITGLHTLCVVFINTIIPSVVFSEMKEISISLAQTALGIQRLYSLLRLLHTVKLKLAACK